LLDVVKVVEVVEVVFVVVVEKPISAILANSHQ